MKKIAFLVLFFCQLNNAQEIDTVVIKDVYISDIHIKEYFTEIKKKYKNNLNTNSKSYNFSFESKNQNKTFISEKGTCNIGSELFKRELPSCIKNKIETDYFASLDDKDSPYFILTNSRLFYLNISKLLDKINLNLVEFMEEDYYIDFSFKYRDYNCVLRINKKTKNVISLELKSNLIEKSSTRSTKGTVSFLNSETNYLIEKELIKMNFQEENDKIVLKSYEHDLEIPNYEIKVYEENKDNKLKNTYNFNLKTHNYINLNN